MSELDESFAQLLGRQPTDKDRQDLYRVRDALKIKATDAVWLLLMVLQHYQTLYERIPASIAEAARDATKTARATAEAQAKLAQEETKKGLMKAVREAAVVSAERAAGARYWKWVSVAATVICLVISSWSRRRRTGAVPHRASRQARTRRVARYEDAAAAASWANTPEGQLAFGLAKAGSITELARCSGAGWKVRDGMCFPKPEKGVVRGWRLLTATRRGGSEMKHVVLEGAPPPANQVSAQLAELTIVVRDVQAAVRALEKRIPARLVSVKEAAETLGCSESTVWRKIKVGEIPHRRIGRTVRVDLSRLRALDRDEVEAMAARARSR